MTPKEKAKYLIDLFEPLANYDECDCFTERQNMRRRAIQISIICINELKNHTINENNNIDTYFNQLEDEINKLKLH